MTFGLALAVTVALAVYWLTRAPASQPALVPESSATAVSTSPTGTGEPPPVSQGAAEAAVALDASASTPPLSPPVTSPTTASDPVAAAASIEDIVGRAMPAVVLIETPSGRGSGFYVRPDTLLTNVHVVQNNSVVTVKRADGASVSARVESRAPAFDIAVLKVLSAAPGQVVIPLGKTSTLRQGQDLIVIGSPLGLLQNTVTRGIVSALRRAGIATLVQTDAAINPGNSGGPVLDRTGTAVGITTMSFRDSQGLHFAVAIDHAQAILDGTASPSETALNNAAAGIGNLSPPGSEAENARAQGQRVFEATLDDYVRIAASFDVEWRRFKDQCYGGTIVGVFDHEWFAVLASGAMPGPVALACGPYATEFKNSAQKFQNDLRSAADAARRAGVDPGPIRDALRSRRLDFPGWSR